MENNGGYSYGIWLLLTPLTFVPFRMNHKLHITLISNITCKRTAQNIFLKILTENKITSDLPNIIQSNSFKTIKIVGTPLSAICWKIPFHHWNRIKEKINQLYPKGNVPEIPHVSLQYYRSQDFNFADWYYKDLSFSLDLVLVDMNDPDPQNWKIIS